MIEFRPSLNEGDEEFNIDFSWLLAYRALCVNRLLAKRQYSRNESIPLAPYELPTPHPRIHQLLAEWCDSDEN